MALSKISDIRDLDNDDLQNQIIETKKHLFDLRFQKATRQLEKTHQFKHARHRLAQLLTVERERELSGEQVIDASLTSDEVFAND